MKRLLLVAVLLGLLVAPAHAQAAAPCWKQVQHDWVGDGKIASTYPLHCYREAYDHLGADAKIYSSLGDDIHRALAAAVARHAGKRVPPQVGKGFTPKRSAPARTRPSRKIEHAVPVSAGPSAAPVVADASSSGSGGVPVPLLVLGGLALALLAVGGVGVVTRRR